MRGSYVGEQCEEGLQCAHRLDSCPLSHGSLEVDFHPDVFKRRLCRFAQSAADGQCDRSRRTMLPCPSAHSEEELAAYAAAYDAAGLPTLATDDRYGVMTAQPLEVMVAFAVSTEGEDPLTELAIRRIQEACGWTRVDLSPLRRCPLRLLPDGVTWALDEVVYSSALCQAANDNPASEGHRVEDCPSGEGASFCHSKLEWYCHPDRLWVDTCRYFDSSVSGSCRQLVRPPYACGFAHSPEQLRSRGGQCVLRVVVWWGTRARRPAVPRAVLC